MCDENRQSLFELNLRAGRFEFLFDFLGFCLCDVFFHRLRSGLNEVFGFLQTKAGDGAYFFNYANLVRTALLQDDGEFSLGFGSWGGSGSHRGGSSGGSGRNAPLAFEVFNEGSEVENRLT